MTVTNSIAALTISGVSICDVDEISDAVGLDTAVLAPMPAGFISDIALTYDEITQQLCRLEYTLNYRYYHCKIAGGLGGLFATYAGLITNAAAIMLAFSNDATLAGAMNNTAPIISGIGPVTDPTGNGFHGFDISLRIMQFLEV
jgi:hypothetical protein